MDQGKYVHISCLEFSKDLIKYLHVVVTKLEKCDWKEVYLSESARLYSDSLFDL